MSSIVLPPVIDTSQRALPSPCLLERAASPPLSARSRRASRTGRVAAPPALASECSLLRSSGGCGVKRSASSRRSSQSDISDQRPSSRRSSRSSISERAHPWSPCTKEEMWEVYDVFRFFSKGAEFVIKRRCFFEGLRECLSMKRLDVVRRTGLRERFKESAQDVTLEEFVRMYLPGVSDDERNNLIRWSHLREAQLQLQGIHGGSMNRGDDQDSRDPPTSPKSPKSPREHEDSLLRTIFNLLDVNCDQRVSLEELQVAEILTAEEVTNLFEMKKTKSKANTTKAIAAVVCGVKSNSSSDGDSRPLDEWCDPVSDGKLSYRDFCLAVRCRALPDPSSPGRRSVNASAFCTLMRQNGQSTGCACPTLHPLESLNSESTSESL